MATLRGKQAPETDTEDSSESNSEDEKEPDREEQPKSSGSAGATKLPIQIRTMNGKTYKIDAKTDWDVKRLKAEFEKWHGGDANMCQLYFKAKKLQDDKGLLTYKINAGNICLVHVL